MIFIFSSSVVLSSLSITSSEKKMNNNFKNLILQAPSIEWVFEFLKPKICYGYL